jgi:hypothetical protein
MAQQMQIKNERISGVCGECEKASDTLFAPPLMDPGDWHQIGIIGDQGIWELHFGQETLKVVYNVVFDSGKMFLRPFKVQNDPICSKCWVESLLPWELKFVVNVPSAFISNVDPVLLPGWRLPE